MVFASQPVDIQRDKLRTDCPAKFRREKIARWHSVRVRNVRSGKVGEDYLLHIRSEPDQTGQPIVASAVAADA